MYQRRCKLILRLVGWTLCVWPIFLAGCTGVGSDQVQRHALQGKVIFDSVPVASGEILFAPDSDQGNRGPGSLVAIENGTYSLPKSQGVVGGHYIVTVRGFKEQSGKDVDGEQLPPIELFSPVELQLELPKGGTFDITVPDQEK